MSFLALLPDAVAGVVVSMVVAVAAHVPFVMNALMHQPAPLPVVVTKNTSVSESALKIKGTIAPQGDGWSLYTSDEWNLSFTYPSSWQVLEKNRTEEEYQTQGKGTPIGALTAIYVTGDGYEIKFDRAGRGIPETYSPRTEYMISGNKARAWIDERPEGYALLLALYPACHGLVIGLSSPTTTDEVTTRILSSVTCTAAASATP